MKKQFKEQLISFDTAKLAKEKGFDVKCKYFFNEDGEVYYYGTIENYNDDTIFTKDHRYSAPTQSLLQKWLREEHDIVVYVLPHAPQKLINTKVELYSPCLWYKNEYQSEMASAKLYEDALKIGLQEALKLLS